MAKKKSHTMPDGKTMAGSSHPVKDDNWIQDALDAKGKKGKPRGEGTLTNQAEGHGMSVEEFAREVRDNPDKYDTITKQRVNFYRTLQKLN